MTEPPTLESLLAHEATIISCRPWPRAVVGTACWSALIDGLKDRRWTMLGLWGEPTMVHLALYEPARRSFALASFACPDGRYPSVGRVHPAALRLERTLVDLYGLVPEGLPDQRPWLDHGRWPRRRPLAPEPAAGGTPEPYPFLPVRGEGLHQIPVGPVHAGIIEPGHFRFTCAGETVVRLEERLGCEPSEKLKAALTKRLKRSVRHLPELEEFRQKLQGAALTGGADGDSGSAGPRTDRVPPA